MTDQPSTSDPPAAAPRRSGPRRLLRWLTVALWLLCAMTVVVFAMTLRQRPPAPIELELLPATGPPIYDQLPDFALTNRDGTPVDRQRLLGEPWVADFVFTRCPGVCPLLSKTMAELAADVPPDRVRLVSVSVDPEHDTPAVLEAYAQRYGAGPNWLFLTGATEDVYALIREGFQLVLDPSPRVEGAEPIQHSNRFVLVDADGRIRGYYDAFTEDEMLALRRDLQILLADPGRAADG
ncbi:MAG: SCO family protein [Acidobacteriota bacterium]